MLASLRRRLTSRTVLAVVLFFLAQTLLWAFHRLFDDAFVRMTHELYSRYGTRWIASSISWYVENPVGGALVVFMLIIVLLWVVAFVDDRILAREVLASKTSSDSPVFPSDSSMLAPVAVLNTSLDTAESAADQKNVAVRRVEAIVTTGRTRFPREPIPNGTTFDSQEMLPKRTARPEVVPFLELPPGATAFWGAIIVENIGDMDAFNVEIGDVSNGRSVARFGTIDRLKAGSKQERVPVIAGAPTKSGVPDLFSFARQGQMALAWDTIANDTREVPPDEIEQLVRKEFIAPFDITYEDSGGGRWITHAELLLGKDHAGLSRLAIRFKRIASQLGE
jgi:hypothetical protein